MIDDDDGFGDDGDLPSEIVPESSRPPVADDDNSFGLFSSYKPGSMSVDEMVRIVEARTGQLIDIDDPVMVELVALDQAFRFHIGEQAKMIQLHGGMLDTQAKNISDQISDGVGGRIDVMAEGVVKAIVANSAAVNKAVEEAKRGVEEAQLTMIRVTAAAKVLLAVTGGIAAVVITALISAAIFIVKG